jgi:hypothetical protein
MHCPRKGAINATDPQMKCNMYNIPPTKTQ